MFIEEISFNRQPFKGSKVQRFKVRFLPLTLNM